MSPAAKLFFTLSFCVKWKFSKIVSIAVRTVTVQNYRYLFGAFQTLAYDSF